MVLNNNGQAITLNKHFANVGYGDLEAARAALESKSPTVAMTFPGGTHDTWLRYWLRATKADASKVKIIPVPPPEMVANMKVGNMDGYCVGEPWNAVAVAQGIGFTHLTTQDLWRFHPEKALVVGERFAAEQPDVLADLMAARATGLQRRQLSRLSGNRPVEAQLGGPRPDRPHRPRVERRRQRQPRRPPGEPAGRAGLPGALSLRSSRRGSPRPRLRLDQASQPTPSRSASRRYSSGPTTWMVFSWT